MIQLISRDSVLSSSINSSATFVHAVFSKGSSRVVVSRLSLLLLRWCVNRLLSMCHSLSYFQHSQPRIHFMAFFFFLPMLVCIITYAPRQSRRENTSRGGVVDVPLIPPTLPPKFNRLAMTKLPPATLKDSQMDVHHGEPSLKAEVASATSYQDLIRIPSCSSSSPRPF
jgi:hypothetical protein